MYAADANRYPHPETESARPVTQHRRAMGSTRHAKGQTDP